MEDNCFEIYDEYGNPIAAIQIFTDMDSYNGHSINISVSIDYYEEYIDFDDDDNIMEELYNETIDYLKNDYSNQDKGSHLVDGVLDYLDKHNRNAGY